MIMQCCKHEHFVIQFMRRMKDGGAESRPHLEIVKTEMWLHSTAINKENDLIFLDIVKF